MRGRRVGVVLVVVVVVVGKRRWGVSERDGVAVEEEMGVRRVRRRARDGAVVRGSSITADVVRIVWLCEDESRG